MKRLAVATSTVALLTSLLALPAEAHNRCDHRDHSHWVWRGGPVYERWRYLRMEFGVPWVDVWSVNGRLVRLSSSICH